MSTANQPSSQSFNASGSKYLREMRHLVDGRADVYAVLIAFNVVCPARQHAIKKLLCSGIRGKGDCLQDLREARDAIDRAIQFVERDAQPAVTIQLWTIRQ
jgi:hypothetical protein